MVVIVLANVGKIVVYRGNGLDDREFDVRSSRMHSSCDGAGAHSDFSVLYGCPRPRRRASRDHGRRPWRVRQRASANRYDLGVFEDPAADSFASGFCTVYAPSSTRYVYARQGSDRQLLTASAALVSVSERASIRAVEPLPIHIHGPSFVDGSPALRVLGVVLVYFR